MAPRIGIGSWADPEYTGILYPEGIAAGERLAVYAKWFDYVEVNSSYYAVPRRDLVKGWTEQTPPGFVFDVKLPRPFSRSPRKTAEGDLAERLLEAVQPLIDTGKLGAFLLTLEPGFSPERNELSDLDIIAERLRPHTLAVELRHNEWVTEKNRASTLAYFRERGLVWVAVDMPRIPASTLMPAVDEVTRADLSYLRLHGHNKNYLQARSAEERHLHEYTVGELEAVVGRIGALAQKAKTVHVVANNHARNFAPRAALELKRLLNDRERTISAR